MKEYWSKQNSDKPISPDLDLESIWEEIEEKRNRKKKRRILFFLLPVFTIGIFLLVINLVFNEKPLTEIVVSDSIDEQISSRTTETDKVNYNNETIEDALDQKSIDDNNAKEEETKSNYIFNNRNKLELNATINFSTSASEPKTVLLYTEPNNGLATSELELLETKNLIRTIQNNQLLEQPIGLLKLSKRKLDFIPKPKNDETFRSEIFIGSRVMLGFSHRNFTTNQSLNDQRYFQNRKDSESTLENYGMEWSIKRTVSPSIFFETGILFSNITSKSEHQYQVQSMDIVQGDSAVIIEQLDGTIEYSSGTAIEYKTETYNNIKYNHFWTIGIPVRMGYQKQINPSMTIGLASGVVYNLSTRGNGYIISPDSNESPFSSLSSMGYNTNHFFQTTSHLFINYSINEKWNIECGGHYIRDLNSRTSLSEITDRYQSINAQIGVLYKLN